MKILRRKKAQYPTLTFKKINFWPTYVRDKTITNDPRRLIFLYVVLKAIPNNFAFL